MTAADLVADSRADAKARARMDKVARAAARLFSTRTYLATTMDGIAAAAKVSKGGMYYYFETKADVLFYIVDRVLDDLMEDLEGDLAACADDNARLRLLIGRHVGYYRGHLHEVRTLLNDRRCLEGRLAARVAEKEQAYFDIASGVVGAWLGPDDRRRAPATFALFGVMNWIPGWYRPRGKVDLDDLIDLTWRLFTGGIENLGEEDA